MPGIEVSFTEKTAYKIFLSESGWRELAAFLKKNYSNKKILIVSDSGVPETYYWKIIKETCEFLAFCMLYIIPEGEQSKSAPYIDKIHKRLFKNNFNRDDLLIALGGGVVGDLAGFAASIYKRGIPYVQVPTTLLSMVDSSVGGKTAVNTKYSKNSIGSFYNPETVFINTETLKTLEQRHILNGLAEVIKSAIIGDRKMFDLLVNEKDKVTCLEPTIILDLIRRSLNVKASVVSRDMKENGLRALLNLGHTTAHAIEKASGHRILHGEAVALGILTESKILEDKKFLSGKDVRKIENLVRMYGYTGIISKWINFKQIPKYILQDKKNKGDTVRITRISGIGDNLDAENVIQNCEIEDIQQNLKNILNRGN